MQCRQCVQSRILTCMSVLLFSLSQFRFLCCFFGHVFSVVFSGVYSGGAKYCFMLNFIDLTFPNSVIGTSSLRRAAQLKKKFPQLEFRDIVSFCFKMLNLGKVAERIMEVDTKSRIKGDIQYLIFRNTLSQRLPPVTHSVVHFVLLFSHDSIKKGPSFNLAEIQNAGAFHI